MQWAGIIFVNRRGEVLLNLRDDKPEIAWPNAWDLIGGVVEAGETPDECIVRETMEETGEALGSLQPFRSYPVPLRDGREAQLHVYYASLDKRADELVLGEGQEHRFFAPSALSSITIVRGIEGVLRDFLASPEYLNRR